MLRQRLHSRTSRLTLVGRILTFLLALALVFYGGVLLLLALGAAPGGLNAASGYRDAYDTLAGLREGDTSTLRRAAAAGAGLLGFLLFGLLALKAIPRPYLARHAFELVDDDRGIVTVEARAIERVAEAAAAQHPAVGAAAGRYGDDELSVGVTVRDAARTAETLTAVQSSIAAALEKHGLPAMPIHLTLTGFERRTERTLA